MFFRLLLLDYEIKIYECLPFDWSSFGECAELIAVNHCGRLLQQGWVGKIGAHAFEAFGKIAARTHAFIQHYSQRDHSLKLRRSVL